MPSNGCSASFRNRTRPPAGRSMPTRWNSNANMACSMPVTRAARRLFGQCWQAGAAPARNCRRHSRPSTNCWAERASMSPRLPRRYFDVSEKNAATNADRLQVFTLHAELEGMLLLNSFESLLTRWQAAGVSHHAHGDDSSTGHSEAAAGSEPSSWVKCPGAQGYSPFSPRTRRRRESDTSSRVRARVGCIGGLQGSSPSCGWRPWRAARSSIPTKDATRRFRAKCSAAATGSSRT